MTIYCIEQFKVEFENLKSKKLYRSLEKEIIDYFFDRTVSELSSGIRLNNSTITPYIKKRLNGSGGFRVYYLLIINKENVYLMYVHPKTGPSGSENILDSAKAELYKEVLKAIESNNLYLILKDNGSLIFNETNS